MFIQLKNHKAHVFIKNEIDPSKENLIFIPGAGMDHRTISMFNLDTIETDHNIIAFDLPGHGYTSGPLFKDVESHTNFCIELIEKIKNQEAIGKSHTHQDLIFLVSNTTMKGNLSVVRVP